MSMRIPAPDGSIVDLTVSLAKETTYEEVCAAMKAACEGDLKDVMAYEDQPHRLFRHHRRDPLQHLLTRRPASL